MWTTPRWRTGTPSSSTSWRARSGRVRCVDACVHYRPSHSPEAPVRPIYTVASHTKCHHTRVYTGHRVCLLSAAAEAPRAHCAAVLRKLGADRAQIDGAFACLPLLPPLVNDGAATEFAGGPAWRQALLRRAADFFGSDAGSEGGKGEGGGTGGGRVLVLDDASLAAGVLGPRAVVELVEACRALLRGQQEQEPEPGSLLVRAMDGDDGDDEGTAAASVPLLPLLLRHADALVEVRPLASGYSWDVHGLVRKDGAEILTRVSV